MVKGKKFNRYNVLLIIMIAIFFAIGSKLYYLQIFNGQYYKDKAKAADNTHKLSVEAPRGLITDKNGINLANETPGYNLTYTNTNKSSEQLFANLQEVFSILDENKEVQTDSFPLKIDPYRFEFSSSDPETIQVLLLRFLKDRGLQDDILKNNFENKKEEDLTTSEKTVLNNELLKLTPQEIYEYLLKEYGVTKGISSLNIKTTPNLIRRYLIVKDAIKLNFYTQYKSISIATNMKKDTALILEQSLALLPGFKVENVPLRQYPYGELASSVLGYISKISPADKAKYSAKGYDTSVDYIGTSGIEAAMESSLKGVNGEEEVIIDDEVTSKDGASNKESTPGNNVQLTIDANLQYATESALNTVMKNLQKQQITSKVNSSNATRGGAVVIDIHTGNVLSLVSLPGYNPNDFSTSQGLTQALSEKYFNPDYEKLAKADGMSRSLINFMFPIDKNIKENTTIRKDKYDYFPKYLYNYATMSLIPPGSTFKPMTAIAGLETGVINASSTYNDIGGYDIGGENKIRGNNWTSFVTDGAQGVVNVVKAIEKSSNPFFMNVSQKLREKFGDDILAKYAWMFGLGANPNEKSPGTGIEISENFGQVYNKESQKNISATQFFYNIEEALTKGVTSDKYRTKFPPLDLYDREGDNIIVYNNKKLSEIKSEIKNIIKDSVKTGSFSKTNYEVLFKQLIAADPMYKGKKFTAANIQSVLTEVKYHVNEGHSSLSRPSNMFFASIGQGMDTFTPLQMANYIATIANGGTRYNLNLVANVKDYNGKLISETKPKVLNKVDMGAETRDLVLQGMNDVTGEGGTAKSLADFPIPTGGKTGTAQSNLLIQDKIGRGDYSWYVGYAPATNPEIAVSIVIFDGGFGSSAVDVAKGMYESYFKDDPRMAKYNNKYDIKLKKVN
ncbi:MAG: peptidoglycan D,D-transpeptidase FtsI family protein [Clostridium sp.]|uniref:peptidoglycan D,D-transpeptidase FtsI family protein n=1 Tax=Clostridium sp. TaxID=1506 RepID=UPI003D6CAF89